MRYAMSINAVARTEITISRLGTADLARLEAHCLRLDPIAALNVLGKPAEPITVKRYLGAIDFTRDVVLVALEPDGTVRAAVRIVTEHGSRWAELLAAREPHRVACEPWTRLLREAIAAARDASIGWLSVAGLGFDPETRDALTGAGFDLQAEEDGTIGELCLVNFR